MRWTVVIPAKALTDAKTRLLPASPDSSAHHRLVQAIRDDTVAAAAAADGVGRVLLVTDRPGLPGAFVQSRPGLNEALIEAAAHARQSWPTDGVAALVGDLPALRAEALAEALAAAGRHPRAFVADSHGTGTTLLTARAGVTLAPEFGAGSAARHAASAVPIEADPVLRHDVDTDLDLRAAAQFGLGPATAAVLATHIARSP